MRIALVSFIWDQILSNNSTGTLKTYKSGFMPYYDDAKSESYTVRYIYDPNGDVILQPENKDKE